MHIANNIRVPSATMTANHHIRFDQSWQFGELWPQRLSSLVCLFCQVKFHLFNGFKMRCHADGRCNATVFPLSLYHVSGKKVFTQRTRTSSWNSLCLP